MNKSDIISQSADKAKIADLEAQLNALKNKPTNITCGFANSVKNKDPQLADNLVVKIAYSKETLQSFIDASENGYTHVVHAMVPNLNGPGHHVGERFVETFQMANKRIEASETDTGFRFRPFMNTRQEVALNN
jgi:hypothetical protein